MSDKIDIRTLGFLRRAPLHNCISSWNCKGLMQHFRNIKDRQLLFLYASDHSLWKNHSARRINTA